MCHPWVSQSTLNHHHRVWEAGLPCLLQRLAIMRRLDVVGAPYLGVQVQLGSWYHARDSFNRASVVRLRVRAHGVGREGHDRRSLGQP